MCLWVAVPVLLNQSVEYHFQSEKPIFFVRVYNCIYLSHLNQEGEKKYTKVFVASVLYCISECQSKQINEQQGCKRYILKAIL